MQRSFASSLPSSPDGYCTLHAISVRPNHLCRVSLVRGRELDRRTIPALRPKVRLLRHALCPATGPDALFLQACDDLALGDGRDHEMASLPCGRPRVSHAAGAPAGISAQRGPIRMARRGASRLGQFRLRPSSERLPCPSPPARGDPECRPSFIHPIMRATVRKPRCSIRSSSSSRRRARVRK